MSPLSGASPENLHLAPLELETWDRLVEASPGAGLFHARNWLDLLAGVYQHTWLPLGLWQGERPVGLFPLQQRRLGPFQLAGSPLMQVIASTPCLGPIGPTLAPGHGPVILAALEAWLEGQRIDHVELAFAAPWWGQDMMATPGYGREVVQAVVLPLEGRAESQLWAGLSQSCQRAVRKAQSSGLAVVESQDGQFLEDYDRMIRAVYRRAGRLPHLSAAFLRAAWTALAPAGRLKVLLALESGRPVAGAFFLLGDGEAYYLSGASWGEALVRRPNNLIQWHFIAWAAGQGYRHYDMGGASVPGITRFKLSFGGHLQPYLRLHRATSGLARAGRGAYGRLLPLWRRFQVLAGS